MEDTEQGSLGLDRPGARLRREREAQGLSIQEISVRTRVPQRQLELVENDDYAGLPGIPYAIGFARSYARAIGVDEVAIAADVRRELQGGDIMPPRYEMFEPADPARVPPRYLAWTAAAIALLIAVGYGVWRTQMFTPPTDEQVAAAPAAAPVRGARPATPAPVDGPVILTATDDVWLRIYDEEGEKLLEKTLLKGEAFTVPTNAANPMILTGRPDALAVTVGGRAVAPLGPPERTVADLPISSAALLARPAAAPASVAASPATAPANETAPQ